MAADNPKITHVIFDLDGTLVDTISTYRDALNATLEPYNKHISWEFMSVLMEIPDFVEYITFIVKELAVGAPVQEFLESYVETRNKMMHKTKLMPGALKLLNYFKSKSIPMGLCTAVSRDFFEFATDHLSEIFGSGNYFETVTTAKGDPEVANNKPMPDPYIVTMQRFRCKPSPDQVLVFEDSRHGVTSALAAGARCVHVLDSRLKAKEIDGVHCISLLTEFDTELYGL